MKFDRQSRRLYDRHHDRADPGPDGDRAEWRGGYGHLGDVALLYVLRRPPG
jgi:hypothetical protein